MTKQEITDLIHTVYDAVNESKIGPVFGVDDKGQRTQSSIAVYVVQSLIGQLCPKGKVTGEMQMTEAKEDWQE